MIAFGHSRLRQLARYTFTALFFLTGALLINDGRSLIGVLAVAWGFLRIFGMSPWWGEAVATGVNTLKAESCSNVLINVHISVTAVLEHPAVGALFDRLKRLKKVHALTATEWRTSLLEHYRARTANQELLGDELVVFRVRSNIVWKDDQLSQFNCLYHEILIPSEAMAVTPTLSTSTDEWVRYDGLRIRLLVLNGILKLQIGCFDKSYQSSPRGETKWKERTGKWKAWDTVTSFPLLYCGDEHHLPLRLLGIFPFSLTGSNEFVESDKLITRALKKSAKKFRSESISYQALLFSEDVLEREALGAEEFRRKLQEWIKREGFEKSGGRPSVSYENDLLHLRMDDQWPNLSLDDMSDYRQDPPEVF